MQSIQEVIQSSHFPSRLQLLLYVHTGSVDCVYKQDENGSVRCISQIIFPINRLRNLAIDNVKTTHFVVFDMDMWPASMSTIINE